MQDPDVRARIIEEIERALGGGATVAVATVVTPGDPPFTTPGDRLLVRRDGTSAGSLGVEALDAAVTALAVEAFGAFPRIQARTLYLGPDGRVDERRSRAREGDAQAMLQLFEAPARLLVVGAGHVGLALAQFGELLGYEVTVLDDRPEFANRERFPMAEVVCGDVEQGLRDITLDDSHYIVLVSRGHKMDEEALRAVAGRGAAYVGMIGSRRRTTTVLRHLLEEGSAREALEAVSTPIGLDIGAETPEEIAVSILAEMTMLRRGGDGRRMSAGRPSLDSPAAEG